MSNKNILNTKPININNSLLNYSIYNDKIENTDNTITLGVSPDVNPIFNIYPKTNDKWVDSSYVYMCQKCNNKFGLLLRKHHCRACGGVYCYKCCNIHTNIPQQLIKIPDVDKSYRTILSTSYRWLFNKDRQLVCNDCNLKIRDLNELEPLIKIFYYLDLKTLYTICTVSKAYNKAAKYYMTKFRDIQYKNIITDKWEICMLYSMKEYEIFHSVWFTILIKTIYMQVESTNQLERLQWLNEIIKNITIFSIDGEYNRSKKVSCWNLLCSRKCVKTLEADDIINVLLYISNNTTTNDILWENKENKEIVLNLLILLMRKCAQNLHIYIGLICKILKNFLSNEIVNLDKEYIEKILNIIIFYKINVEIDEYKNLSENNRLKLNLLLFEKNYLEDIGKNRKNIDMETCIFIKEIENYVNNKFGVEIINLLNKSKIFIINLLENNDWNKNIDFDKIIYPLDPNYKIIKINKKTILNSNTKPVIIDAEITNNIVTKNVKFIIKKDNNLRKEQIISCLIDVLQYKINSYKNETNQNNFELIPTYQILMITRDIGLIEYIEDSITLRLINENGYTLQNYILNHNSNLTLDMIKTRFVCSLSISSSISYIIGLGDRHLDNIMINKKGQIFHIDYGYIMENPITSMTSFFEMPQIKVTNDIIDFLGGSQSIYYDNFKKNVIKIYNILRANKNVFNIYFKFICDEGYLNWNVIENKLNQKLMSGMKCKDIEITLINEIESANSFTNMFVDICHTYKQKLF
jgi:hypothetical protein